MGIADFGLLIESFGFGITDFRLSALFYG